jgi:putative ABC transport system permease protein
MISIPSLVWSYLKAKPLNTALNIFLLSLGIAVITLILLFSNQLQQKITDNAKGIDLVVGAKGSPLQLILCNIFHIDFPTGNINLREAERLAKHRLVKNAIPLALGDSFQNFRIVGTSQLYPQLYKAELASGNWWKEDLEVTIGASVATGSKLKLGDQFESSHGLTKEGHAHEESKYIVSGILKPSGTIIDNLILTNIGSVWKVHGESDNRAEVSKMDTTKSYSRLVSGSLLSDSTKEITSLLIKYKNPIAAIQLPRYINTQTNMQAASPSFETARLFTLLGSGADALMGLAYLLVFISALSIFIALYNSLKERKYDLAIMRTMGASKTKIFVTVVAEGVSLTLAGVIIGLCMGHVVIYLFTNLVVASQKAGLTAWIFYVEEVYILIAGILLGFICSLVPAWQAYRMNIHKVLSQSN